MGPGTEIKRQECADEREGRRSGRRCLGVEIIIYRGLVPTEGLTLLVVFGEGVVAGSSTCKGRGL